MYRVQIQDFEGPLDLLLFFIRRDELDVYDIPIARITDEFLEYVRLLEEIDLDNVGDFIYMAALLISIKVRMLLPRPEVDEEGEPIDPRRELVERLLEYMRYKEAAEQLELAHERRGAFFTRGQAASVEEASMGEGPEELLNASVFHLVGALRRVLTETADTEPVHAVSAVEYSVEEQHVYILAQLREKGRVRFLEIAEHTDKGFVIATFLAVLEMARNGEAWLALTETGDDFYVLPPEEEVAQTTQQGRMNDTPMP